MRKAFLTMALVAAGVRLTGLAPRILHAYQSTRTLHRTPISTVLSPKSGKDDA
ncbi:hypothetical protein [Frankia canadensis]|uniref:hypothetical protein n=1 Tax=Frankia canadensis TaxID=1836972 RepID=UPI0014035060|nr:hypothetical protein [Frankia canadensis]